MWFNHLVVVSRLAPVLASWLTSLQSSINSSGGVKSQGGYKFIMNIIIFTPCLAAADELLPFVVQSVLQALSILQGVSLLHHSSKAFLGRSWCLQVWSIQIK